MCEPRLICARETYKSLSIDIAGLVREIDF